MRALTKNIFSTLLPLFLFIFVFTTAAYSITYTTVANGNWNSTSTWDANGVPPTASDIPTTAIINIRHTVAYNTGNPIKNRGEIRIQSFGGSTATLNVPTNINVENFSTGKFYIINGTFLQCRFVGCGNSGTPQSGTFKNIGGYVELTSANVEVAQDWTNESSGTRVMTDSCVTTGQNFSMSASTDTITRSHISIGWHGSGNFQLSAGTVTFDRARVQLAGTSGNFELSSGTANGDIDYITLRNHVTGNIGSGKISASSSLMTSGLNLDAYCVSSSSNYEDPGNKFSGTETPTCSLNFFPASCSVAPVLSAGVSIEGRVLTAKGQEINGVVLEISGGDLPQPIRVRTDSSGAFVFENMTVGHAYVITIYSKQYVFSNPTRVVTLQESLTGFDFIAEGRGMNSTRVQK